MKRNGKLSAFLHALVHMAHMPGRAMTSEEIGAWLNTNPVVVRRSVAGLREAGILSSSRGHGGGWTLARPAETITLADIASALEERLIPFNTEPDNPNCLVERAVNKALDGVKDELEQLLRQRLADVTLADLAVQCGAGVSAHLEKQRGH
ncbi:Rrf2 family transcriptional regulator [Mesorhizobium sp. VNQ89]|uniref:RrF2 family transcriptional regulator n=1 Tax=Mesorhizobium quangtriensis TaxID=3157709 RepID=UPI0032B73716